MKTLKASAMSDPSTIESRRSMVDGGPTLHRLLTEHGFERYALFFTTGEGRVLPNGEEEVSGSVLLPDGRCFAFWTGWDPEQARPRFRIWRQEEPEPDWRDSAEYQRARAAVGLA